MMAKPPGADLNPHAKHDQALAEDVRRILRDHDWRSGLKDLLRRHPLHTRNGRVLQKAVYSHLHGADAIEQAARRKKDIRHEFHKLLLKKAPVTPSPLRPQAPAPGEALASFPARGAARALAVRCLAKSYVLSGQLDELMDLSASLPEHRPAIDRGMLDGFSYDLEGHRTDLFAKNFIRLSREMPDFFRRMPAPMIQRGLDRLAEDTVKGFFARPGAPEDLYLRNMLGVIASDPDMRRSITFTMPSPGPPPRNRHFRKPAL